MLDDRPLSVGDDLVEFGKVYKVFKIEDKLSFNGTLEKHVFFRPFFATADNNTLSCSVPLSKVKEANIRRPVTKKELSDLMHRLSNGLGHVKVTILDVNEAKNIFKLNDPFESAKVLKTLWDEIRVADGEVAKSRKDILELSVKSLSQEVALAFNITLEKAEKKIREALKKAS